MPAHALIEWVRIYKRGNQHIIALSDHHGIGSDAMRISHQNAIISLAQEFDAHVIVEDSVHPGDLYQLTSKEVADRTLNILKTDVAKKHMLFTDVLHGLTQNCLKNNISVKNVEIRHLKLAGSITWINEIVKDHGIISTRHMVELFDNVIKEIEAYPEYKDITFYKAYINDAANALNQLLNELKKNSEDIYAFIRKSFTRKKAKSHAKIVWEHISEFTQKYYNYLPYTSEAPKRYFYEICISHANAYLDPRIVHEIHTKHIQNNEAKPIIIAAGDLHIQHVERGLKELGYERTFYQERTTDKKSVEQAPRAWFSSFVQEQLTPVETTTSWFKNTALFTLAAGVIALSAYWWFSK